MKQLSILCALLPVFLFAQPEHPTAKVFIITTDGFRWHELFEGADSMLLFNSGEPQAIAGYWSCSMEERRRKLMPFMWTQLAVEGQLLGNRNYGNEVTVKNAFKISYPGYNEILTGYPDPVLIPNLPIRNRNRNILGRCNATAALHGRVAAFTTWKLFPFILNQHRDHLVLNPVCSDQDHSGSPDEKTFCRAMAYLQRSKPDLVLISFGETDHWAHQGNYLKYLESATRVDEMIGKLWQFVQNDPYYRGQTSFIITTDHGRGEEENWFTHGPFSKGSGEAWLALLGPGVSALGEIKTPRKMYQTQIAPVVAWLMQVPFDGREPDHNPLIVAFSGAQRENGNRKVFAASR
ncbi:MAG TPA: alkaline phosphatase family protein [Puia sp.]|nr:alkaline phosphatase family protein [Puia sp.]